MILQGLKTDFTPLDHIYWFYPLFLHLNLTEKQKYNLSSRLWSYITSKPKS